MASGFESYVRNRVHRKRPPPPGADWRQMPGPDFGPGPQHLYQEAQRTPGVRQRLQAEGKYKAQEYARRRHRYGRPPGGAI